MISYLIISFIFGIVYQFFYIKHYNSKRIVFRLIVGIVFWPVILLAFIVDFYESRNKLDEQKKKQKPYKRNQKWQKI